MQAPSSHSLSQSSSKLITAGRRRRVSSTHPHLVFYVSSLNANRSPRCHRSINSCSRCDGATRNHFRTFSALTGQQASSKVTERWWTPKTVAVVTGGKECWSLPGHTDRTMCTVEHTSQLHLTHNNSWMYRQSTWTCRLSCSTNSMSTQGQLPCSPSSVVRSCGQIVHYSRPVSIIFRLLQPTGHRLQDRSTAVRARPDHSGHITRW
jgi:hypothetical protein